MVVNRQQADGLLPVLLICLCCCQNPGQLYFP